MDNTLVYPEDNIDFWLEANQGDDFIMQFRGDGTIAMVKDNEEREVIARFSQNGYLIPLDDCCPPIDESNEEWMNLTESECEVAQAPSCIDESGNEVYDDGVYVYEHDGIYSFSFNPISINEDHVELPSCALDISHEELDSKPLECDLKDINLDSSIQLPLETTFIHPFQKIPHLGLELHASQILIDYFGQENNTLFDSTSLMIESSKEEHFSETPMDHIDTFIKHTDKYDVTSVLLSSYSLVKSISALDLNTWETLFDEFMTSDAISPLLSKDEINIKLKPLPLESKSKFLEFVKTFSLSTQLWEILGLDIYFRVNSKSKLIAKHDFYWNDPLLTNHKKRHK